MTSMIALYCVGARLKSGAVLVDWTGIHLNRFVSVQAILWQDVQATDGRTLHLKTGEIIQISRCISALTAHELHQTIEGRRTLLASVRDIQMALRAPMIVDEKCRLSRWSKTDYAGFQFCFQDASMTEHMRYSNLSTAQLRDRFFHYCTPCPEAVGVGHLCIQHSGRYIGHFDWWVSMEHPLRITIAYGILPDFRRSGVMTHVLKHVCENILSHTACAEVVAVCAAKNSASQALLRKVGFECERIRSDGAKVYLREVSRCSI